jgi:uncharacterized protein with HEPN domain
MKSKRDEKVFIQDIWECIQKIERYTKNISERQFELNNEKQDAVIRRLEIIGEAVKKLSPDFRKKYPDIPWKKIAGMRDLVIHEYFGVSIGLIWLVATSDIPKLKKEIRKIRKDIGL